MKAFARIARLERLLRRKVRGLGYVMPDNTLRILPYQHLGFSDAVQGINSPQARIIRNAVTDYNHGAMLQLLRAVMNPIETETVQDNVIAIRS